MLRFLRDWLDSRYERFQEQSRAEAERLVPAFWNVSAGNPDWKRHYIEGCESPAESAFLNAFMERFEFRPTRGVLVSSSIKLAMQVRKDPYRLDFLIDDWLIVEIDGATYHSSPEAIERDRIRDAHFTRQGFTVLRIPASAVFADPNEAIERALQARQKRESPDLVAAPKAIVATRPTMTFGQVLRTIEKVSADMNRAVKEAAERQQAEAPVRLAALEQRLRDEQAADREERRRRIDERFPPGSESRKLYDAEYEKVLAKLNEVRSSREPRG